MGFIIDYGREGLETHIITIRPMRVPVSNVHAPKCFSSLKLYLHTRSDEV